jgi:hypothetical protein
LQRRLQQAHVLALRGDTDLGLLPRAVDEAAANAREQVFQRLALLYPAREMLRAHRGLSSQDDRIRAFALEYLEATLTQADRDRVLPLLRGPVAGAAVPLEGLLAELADDPDEWVATLAVHAIGLSKARTLRRVVEALPEGDAVRQETVRWALARL